MSIFLLYTSNTIGIKIEINNDNLTLIVVRISSHSLSLILSFSHSLFLSFSLFLNNQQMFGKNRRRKYGFLPPLVDKSVLLETILEAITYTVYMCVCGGGGDGELWDQMCGLVALVSRKYRQCATIYRSNFG